MGPAARSIYERTDSEGRKNLENYMHVMLNDEMWETVKEVAKQFPEDAVFEGKMPAPKMIIETEGDESSFWELMHNTADDRVTPNNPDQESVAIALTRVATGEINELCWYDAKSRAVGLMEVLSQKVADETGLTKEEIHGSDYQGVVGQTEAFETGTELCALFDTLLILMCEPRLVVQSAPQRARRKRVAKLMGKKAIDHTWVELKWTLGETCKAKGQPESEGPMKAYHLVRGHWRYYDRQTPKSELAPDGFRWRVWIEAHHSGHPAMGVVQKRYAPKAEDPGKSSHMLNQIIAGKLSESIRARHTA